MKYILCILLLIVSSSLEATLYEVLEVKQDASDQDIYISYKKLSEQYKPENNPGNFEAHQKYEDIQRAYEILKDGQKRQVYDYYGEDGLDTYEYLSVDAFGNKRSSRGSSKRADIPVTLEDLYKGFEKVVTIDKDVICSHCHGTGDKDGVTKTCKKCKGTGTVMQNVQMAIGFNVQMQTTCPVCKGKGKMSASNCPVCKGAKVVRETKDYTVKVKPGMKDKQKIIFKGESDQHPDNLAGDIIFQLVQQPHSYFKRAGNNLYMDVKISLKEAIMGFSRNVKHLDNHYTEIKCDEVVSPNQVKIIKGEGMPFLDDPSKKGDLHVKFIIQLPKKISKEDRVLLEKIFQ